MTIDQFLYLLRRQWRVVMVFAFTFGAIATGVTLLMPKVYSATTTQFVRGVPGVGVGAEYQAAQFATSRAKSYSVMVANPDVLTGIIKDLNLQMTAGDLLTRITAENPIDTNLINITARATTPDMAREISVHAADNLAKLIVRIESSGTTGGKSPIDIQTAVPASTPTSPTSPRAILNVGVGTLLGLALGTIVALIRDKKPRKRATRGKRRSSSHRPHPEGADVATANSNLSSSDMGSTAHLPSDRDLPSAIEPAKTMGLSDGDVQLAQSVR